MRAAAALVALTAAACAVPDLHIAPDTLVDEGPPPLSNQTELYIEFHGAGGADHYTCVLDESEPFDCASPVVAFVAEGEHTFTVAATLGDATDTTPARVHWRVDTTPPDTTLLAQPPFLTASTAAQLWFGGSDDQTDAGDLRYECELDSSGEFLPCASPATFHLPDVGEDLQHVVNVRAVDAAGNVDFSPAFAFWEVDTLAPETVIEDDGSPLDGEITGRSVTFFVTTPVFDKGGDSFECALDGGTYRACFDGQSYFIPLDGVHTFAARATDDVGNVDPTPATRTWTVMKDFPNVTFVQTPPFVTTDPGTVFTWTTTAPVPDPPICLLDGHDIFPCDSPLDLGALDVGTHDFLIIYSDRFSNTSQAEYIWEIDAP